MSLDVENEALMRQEADRAGYTITRAKDARPHSPRKQRNADEPDFELHPAIARGLQQFRETADCGGAAALTLFSMPALHVSYAWFKSGYPLPLHSHDADCYYLVIAGSMHVGTEELGKGDGVLIPAGAPYTVSPGDAGVEFLEMRTSPDYDTHYRAKTDAYWDRIADTRRARKDIWAKEPAPYGLVPMPDVAPQGGDGELEG
jgi:mannose-6-phosphate isomerase-like protein (cupin superfamily)